jgi:short subunit dehydrogenase-like uncharacterized protein
MPTDDRKYDIVLFGATGFTGALTAEYLAANAATGTRWALAGRNQAKLDALAERLGGDPDTLMADVTDPGSLRRIADATRVVITTVGPYIRFGEPLVAACAEAGTDYVDLTGEPEFVDRMYLAHHERATQTGARLIHACGFDSIPHDLGAQHTVEQLPEGVPLTVSGYVSAGGTASGGTFDSAVTAFSRARQTQQAHAERGRVEPRPAGRRVRAVTSRPGREDGGFTLPMPTIDPMVIAASARALDRYGPDFSYSHNVRVTNPLIAAAMPVGIAGVFALSQLAPTRKAMLKLRPSGSGPTPEQRAKSWFRVRFVGEGGGRRAVTQVSGGDPGYGETSKMLAESALCLAHDDLPATAGQVTTAVAMGPVLRARLQAAGITFEVLSESAA